MKIPFSLPYLNEDVINEVNDVFTNTGWITSGPKVKKLEEVITKFTGCHNTVCVNSWTSGAMLALKWFGIGEGDEVIIPAYTYSATALAVMNIGAIPIMVDIKDDFTIDHELIKEKITSKTKAIIPVDIGGWPADYNAIYKIVEDAEVKRLFNPENDRQNKLGRLLVLADAAHSIGAFYNGKNIGSIADITVFSFHSVKNITTGEGGAVCLNLPPSFDSDVEYKFLKAFSLNGQTKSAFEKNQPGAWKYDIIDQGLKVNMTDVAAAIGLAQINIYKDQLLPERRNIFEKYNNAFSEFDWAILPPFEDVHRRSSYHLYQLRIKNASEEQRDEIISLISKENVGVNVHYIPMAMLTLFINKGYNIQDYPKTYELYSNEISLPVYNGLTNEQLDYIITTIINQVAKVL